MTDPDTDHRRGPDAHAREVDLRDRRRRCGVHHRVMPCGECAEVARVRAAEIREALKGPRMETASRSANDGGEAL